MLDFLFFRTKINTKILPILQLNKEPKSYNFNLDWTKHLVIRCFHEILRFYSHHILLIQHLQIIFIGRTLRSMYTSINCKKTQQLKDNICAVRIYGYEECYQKHASIWNPKWKIFISVWISGMKNYDYSINACPVSIDSQYTLAGPGIELTITLSPNSHSNALIH